MLNLFLDWRAWALVLLLTILTLISSVAKYRLGQGGLETLKEHFPQVSDERWERLGNYFQRWGSPIVFFSFLPLLAWIIPPAAGDGIVSFPAVETIAGLVAEDPVIAVPPVDDVRLFRADQEIRVIRRDG